MLQDVKLCNMHMPHRTSRAETETPEFYDLGHFECQSGRRR